MQSSESSRLVLDTLPDEIVVEIAFWLPVSSIVHSLQLVSLKFLNALRSDYLWRTLTETRIGKVDALTARESHDDWRSAYAKCPFYTWKRIEVYGRHKECHHYSDSAAIIFRVNSSAYVRQFNKFTDERCLEFHEFREMVIREDDIDSLLPHCRVLEDADNVVSFLREFRTNETRSETALQDLLNGVIDDDGEDVPVLEGCSFEDEDDVREAMDLFLDLSYLTQIRLYCLADDRVRLTRCLEHFGFWPWGSPWYIMPEERIRENEESARTGIRWLQHSAELMYCSSVPYHRRQKGRDPSALARIFNVRLGYHLGKMIDKDFCMRWVIRGESISEWESEMVRIKRD